MLLMLDTNICIYGMSRATGSERILRRISGRSFGELVISAVTACELAYGAENSKPARRDDNRTRLCFMCRTIRQPP
jgi:predicted nucleic acid-binding protein